MTQQMIQQMPDFGQDPKAAKAAAKAYAKASRPAYKKKRFIIPAVFVAIIAAQNASGGDKDTTEIETASTQTEATTEAPPEAAAAPTKPKPAPAAPAMVVSAKELIAVLEDNALKAKNTYNGKQVTVSGFVGNIDASGDYFSLDPEADAFILTGVQVETSEKFMDQVSNFTEGQPVTVTGKITGVGEIMGYSLEAETIK